MKKVFGTIGERPEERRGDESFSPTTSLHVDILSSEDEVEDLHMRDDDFRDTPKSVVRGSDEGEEELNIAKGSQGEELLQVNEDDNQGELSFRGNQGGALQSDETVESEQQNRRMEHQQLDEDDEHDTLGQQEDPTTGSGQSILQQSDEFQKPLDEFEHDISVRATSMARAILSGSNTIQTSHEHMRTTLRDLIIHVFYPPPQQDPAAPQAHVEQHDIVNVNPMSIVGFGWATAEPRPLVRGGNLPRRGHNIFRGEATV
ncbi:hypothetical protein ACLOJK_035480 [Asimina triloba]